MDIQVCSICGGRDGRNSSGSWLKIHLPSGTQGWSSASYLQTNYNVLDLLVLTN